MAEKMTFKQIKKLLEEQVLLRLEEQGEPEVTDGTEEYLLLCRPASAVFLAHLLVRLDRPMGE